MNKVRDIPWPRIVAEGTAIIVSILLAFSIQAWWEDRQDQNDEREILRSLQTEFHLQQSQLQWLRRHVGAIRGSANQLLNAAVGPENNLTDREIDRLLYDQTWYVTQTFLANHELTAVMSSGDISLISNIRLRQLLGTWQSGYEYYRNAIRADVEFYRNYWMPYLREEASVQQIFNAGDHSPGDPDMVFPGEKVELREIISHRQLLADGKFQNLLSQRIAFLLNIDQFQPEMGGGGLGTVTDNLQEILDLLEQELAH